TDICSKRNVGDGAKDAYARRERCSTSQPCGGSSTRHASTLARYSHVTARRCTQKIIPPRHDQSGLDSKTTSRLPRVYPTAGTPPRALHSISPIAYLFLRLVFGDAVTLLDAADKLFLFAVDH